MVGSTEDPLCDLPATGLRRLLRAGDISAHEVCEAHLRRIEATNPEVNAIVTLIGEHALTAAAAADDACARGERLGPLHGLPVAHKDSQLTQGIRTTFGSPIHADFVPGRDSLLVERIRGAGAILVGKTNMPEFGAGSHTFNPVFGATRNPHNVSRSAGGSSGGAAAALACGMVPFADGSDLGGSLRNPASFCGVVGFRPSAGRVPEWPTPDPTQTLAVLGPMARTVEDVALFFSAMAGPDERVPISLAEPGSVFMPPLDADLGRPRVAWAPTCGGTMPVESVVATVVGAARPVFEAVGCDVDEAFPDLRGAREIFLVLRAQIYARELGSLLERERRRMKSTLVWNIEQGLELTDEEVARAAALGVELQRRTAAFFERFDFLVLPVSQVAPFPVELEYPTEVAGIHMETYVDWMESCWCITVTGHPAISVPCGVTPEGLPVGVQIVGRRDDDLGLLRLAHAFERAQAGGGGRLS